MAKGQKRSNREVRKPKQIKSEAKPEPPFANRVKLSATAAGPREKGRG
jgi:hypothetical protein